MSRKDYIAIAKAVRNFKKSTPDSNVWERIAKELGIVLKNDNPRFDWNRFWDYIER